MITSNATLIYIIKNIRGGTTVIEIKQLVKRYKTKKHDVTAVDHVDLTIPSGTIFGVIGFSGAGKSTLVRLLNYLETPTSGDVIIDGDNMGQLSKTMLRRKRQDVSMVFQHFNLLWSRTVIENIMFPLEIAGMGKVQARHHARELVELIGLEGRGNAYPSELSGGQKQRVGIARALANEPSVLLCDEATSALDPQTTDEILDLLLEIKKKRNLTIVIITHEMQVIRRVCDEVAVMENGKVIEQGKVTEVFENPQHAVTRRFVKDDLSDEIDESVDRYIHIAPDDYVVRLNFTGDNTTEPIVSYITRTLDIDINILEGSVKQTKSGALGYLVLHLTEVSDAQFEQFKDGLSRQHVAVEVIRHG
nr:ATP-binding cassette domain-containing protein [Staphylococcus pettenkoferi]